MSIRIVPAILAAAVSVAFGSLPANAQQPPQSLRLYVLDCGIITPPNVDNYGLKPNEVADTRMVTPCFLIAHPRGTLMWDTGEIPDGAFSGGVSPQKLNNYTVDRPLLPQLAAIGHTPPDITYLALSHYHGDHVSPRRFTTELLTEGCVDPWKVLADVNGVGGTVMRSSFDEPQEAALREASAGRRGRFKDHGVIQAARPPHHGHLRRIDGQSLEDVCPNCARTD